MQYVIGAEQNKPVFHICFGHAQNVQAFQKQKELILLQACSLSSMLIVRESMWVINYVRTTDWPSLPSSSYSGWQKGEGYK